MSQLLNLVDDSPADRENDQRSSQSPFSTPPLTRGNLAHQHDRITSENGGLNSEPWALFSAKSGFASPYGGFPPKASTPDASYHQKSSNVHYQTQTSSHDFEFPRKPEFRSSTFAAPVSIPQPQLHQSSSKQDFDASKDFGYGSWAHDSDAGDLMSLDSLSSMDMEEFLANSSIDVEFTDEMWDPAEGEVPELPADYERASSVSCSGTDADKLFGSVLEIVRDIICDVDETVRPARICGCAYYHSVSVEFQLNIYRNPDKFNSLTLEVHRMSGRPATFSSFFDEIVKNLKSAGILCLERSQYPSGQFMPPKPAPAHPVSAEKSSSSSSSSSNRIRKSGVPPRPSFPRTHPPKLDTHLTEDCLTNLLEPFDENSTSTLKQQRQTAMTLARACENCPDLSGVTQDYVLETLRGFFRSGDKELMRCATQVLEKVFNNKEVQCSDKLKVWESCIPVLCSPDISANFAKCKSQFLDMFGAKMLSAGLYYNREALTPLFAEGVAYRAELDKFLHRLANHTEQRVRTPAEMAVKALKRFS